MAVMAKIEAFFADVLNQIIPDLALQTFENVLFNVTFCAVITAGLYHVGLGVMVCRACGCGARGFALVLLSV